MRWERWIIYASSLRIRSRFESTRSDSLTGWRGFSFRFPEAVEEAHASYFPSAARILPLNAFPRDVMTLALAGCETIAVIAATPTMSPSTLKALSKFIWEDHLSAVRQGSARVRLWI